MPPRLAGATCSQMWGMLALSQALCGSAWPLFSFLFYHVDHEMTSGRQGAWSIEAGRCASRHFRLERDQDLWGLDVLDFLLGHSFLNGGVGAARSESSHRSVLWGEGVGEALALKGCPLALGWVTPWTSSLWAHVKHTWWCVGHQSPFQAGLRALSVSNHFCCPQQDSPVDIFFKKTKSINKFKTTTHTVPQGPPMKNQLTAENSWLVPTATWQSNPR